METKDIIGALGIASLVYVAGNFILFRNIGAMDYWEARGYINGLIRGSGSSSQALVNLNAWRDYWMQQGGLGFLVDNLYKYGLGAINVIY